MKLRWPVSNTGADGPHVPSQWWISVGYADRYHLGVHTGLDFNMPGYADSGKPVYAMADGEVTFAGDGALIGWPAARQVIVIHHEKLGLWTRYAHLAGALDFTRIKAKVAQGDQLGVIGDYGAPGGPDDHLHFDVAKINLTRQPGDWPGHSANALHRVLYGYVDPIMLFRVANS